MPAYELSALLPLQPKESSLVFVIIVDNASDYDAPEAYGPYKSADEARGNADCIAQALRFVNAADAVEVGFTFTVARMQTADRHIHQ